jgi:alanine racemase
MDLAAVDLRLCVDAVVGDKVTLWGEGLPVEELAAFTDRISYDLLTGVQNRVRFEWKEEYAAVTSEEYTKKTLPISATSR